MASKRLQTSTEYLKIVLKTSISPEEEATAVRLENLFLDGGKLQMCKESSFDSDVVHLIISDEIELVKLPSVYLIWKTSESIISEYRNHIVIPLYRYSDRKEHLADITVIPLSEASRFYERSITFITSSLNS
jgi:hypothetical protein